MAKNSILKKIRKLAINIDWNLSFSGKSKGNKHLLRIVKIAKFLAQNVGADVFIAEAGALLHDVALPSGNDYNYKKNKIIAQEFLIRFKLSYLEINAIAECVATHEGTVKPKTLEAKIVHDADVLEKSGILGIIRHTWKMTNSGRIDSEKILKKDIKKIIDHIKWRGKQLQTPLAKKLHKCVSININIAQLRKIIPIISGLAKNSITTEDIAKIILKELKRNQRIALTRQLNLSYLASFKKYKFIDHSRLLTNKNANGKRYANVP